VEEIEQEDYVSAQGRLSTLYGSGDRLWRGQRLWDLVLTCDTEPDDGKWEAARQNLLGRLRQELAATEAAREAWEEENGEMSEAEEAARLLEATSGRKWSWVRQQENLLRRSIDRKVKLLLDLRRQHDAGAHAQPANHKFQNPDGREGKGQTAADGGTENQGEVRNEPTAAAEPTEPTGGTRTGIQIPNGGDGDAMDQTMAGESETDRQEMGNEPTKSFGINDNSEIKTGQVTQAPQLTATPNQA